MGMEVDDWVAFKTLWHRRQAKEQLLRLCEKRNDLLRQVALMEQIDNLNIEIRRYQQRIMVPCGT